MAAEEALKLSAARYERASTNVARWMLRPGPSRAAALTSWEKAWREYRLALVVCKALCPHRLSRGQKLLARLGLPEDEERPR